MYASTAASDVDHTALSARPRPFWARCTARTPLISSASASAISAVPSVLALSAMVIRKECGKRSVRCACSFRTQGARSISSL